MTGEPAESRDAARARDRRRNRHQNRAHAAPADDVTAWTLGLDSELVFVGDAGTTAPGPAEPPPGNRVDDVLHTKAVAHLRRRPRAVEGAVHRRRSGRRPHPRRRRDGRVGRRNGGQRAQDVRQRAVAILRPARARRGRHASARRRRASSTSPPATRSRPQCASRSTCSTSSTQHDSDIDYFYRSRLPGEPAGGIDDFHTHPAAPRSARINLIFGF